MAPSTIRKAIGAVKDQTSIGLAKVSSNIAPDLDVAIVKATSHDDEPADEKHIREILSLTSISIYATICEQLIEMHRAFTLQQESLAGMRLGDLYCNPSLSIEVRKITGNGTRSKPNRDRFLSLFQEQQTRSGD